jgi:hypothetical protein
MWKAIFIIVVSCLVIAGLTTLVASVIADGNSLAKTLLSLRDTVNTIGLVVVAIIMIVGFLGGGHR